MHVGSVKIIFVKQAIDFLTDMFRFDNISSEITEKLKDESKKTIRQATDITGEAYESFLKEQKSVSIKMKVQSPEIVLPLNFKTFKGPCLVFWPGNLTVIDGLTEKINLQNKNDKAFIEKLKRNLYDSFSITLEDMELEYSREFRLAKADLFDKGLKQVMENSYNLEDGKLNEHDDEFDEKFAEQKRNQKQMKRVKKYLTKRNELYHSMFKDFSISVKIELLKNIFVQLECSDARKKITAELSKLKLKANPEIINELIHLLEMFEMNDEEKNKTEKKRIIGDAIQKDYFEVKKDGAVSLYLIITTRTHLYFFANFKDEDIPTFKISFDDMPNLAFDKSKKELNISRQNDKQPFIVKFSRTKDFQKWENTLDPIKKKIAVKKMKFEEDLKIRARKKTLRKEEVQITNEEIGEEQKQRLEFAGEIVDSIIDFNFKNFTLELDEGEKQFIILTKEMSVNLFKTDSKMELKMSLLDFEIKRKHITEDLKYIITSNYDSSLSSKIFKKDIIQRQRKLINISFTQEKDKPQKAEIYFGCLFITIEPRILKEFVYCMNDSLSDNKKKDKPNPKPEESSNPSDIKLDAIEAINLTPDIYKHLNNSDKKKNEYSEALKKIQVEVTIENISLLLISTVSDSFIPLSQIMIEGGRVDCSMLTGAILVDVKFKDLICFDLTNYPNTLTETKFDEIKPKKLFGRLKNKEEEEMNKVNSLVDRNTICEENCLISVQFNMKDPLVFNLEQGISNTLTVRIKNIHMNLYLQAILRILGFLTDQLLPSLSTNETPDASNNKKSNTDSLVVDNTMLYKSYIAINKPLWIKMDIQIEDTEIHMNMDTENNERMRIYLGKMFLFNDKFLDTTRMVLVDDNDFGVSSIWVDRYSFIMNELQVFLEERKSQDQPYDSKQLMKPFGMEIQIEMAQNELDYKNLFDIKTVCNPNHLYMAIPSKVTIPDKGKNPRLIYDSSMVINTIMKPFIAIMGNKEYTAVMRGLEENVLFNDLCDEHFVIDYVRKEQERKVGGMFINLSMDNIGFVSLDNANENLVDTKIYIDNMNLQMLTTPQGHMHLEMGMENLFGFYLVEDNKNFYEKGFINEFGEAFQYLNKSKAQLNEEFVNNMRNSANLFDTEHVRETRELEAYDSEMTGTDQYQTHKNRFEHIKPKNQKFYLKMTGDNQSKEITLNLKGLQVLVETKTLLTLMDLTAPKTEKDIHYSKIVAKRKWKQAEFMREIQKRDQAKKNEILLKELQGNPI